MKLVKLTHGHLPVKKRTHEYYGTDKTSQCPLCDDPQETQSHVFQCPATLDHRCAAWATLRETLQKAQTMPFLLSQLEHGIRSWQENGEAADWPHDIPELHDRPGTLVYEAYQEQASLGWDNVLKGRLSTAWSIAQNQYATERGIDSGTGRSWIERTILTLWTYSLELWDNRNKQAHTATATSQNTLGKQRLRDAIDKAFTYRNRVAATDRHLFERTTAQRQQDPIRNTDRWLASIEIAVNRHAIEVIQGGNGQTTLHRYWTEAQGRRPRVRLRI